MNWIRVEDELPKEDDKRALLVEVADTHKFVTHSEYPYMVVAAWHVRTVPKMYTKWVPITGEAVDTRGSR